MFSNILTGLGLKRSSSQANLGDGSGDNRKSTKAEEGIVGGEFRFINNRLDVKIVSSDYIPSFSISSQSGILITPISSEGVLGLGRFLDVKSICINGLTIEYFNYKEHSNEAWFGISQSQPSMDNAFIHTENNPNCFKFSLFDENNFRNDAAFCILLHPNQKLKFSDIEKRFIWIKVSL